MSSEDVKVISRKKIIIILLAILIPIAAIIFIVVGISLTNPDLVQGG